MKNAIVAAALLLASAMDASPAGACARAVTVKNAGGGDTSMTVQCGSAPGLSYVNFELSVVGSQLVLTADSAGSIYRALLVANNYSTGTGWQEFEIPPLSRIQGPVGEGYTYVFEAQDNDGTWFGVWAGPCTISPPNCVAAQPFFP